MVTGIDVSTTNLGWSVLNERQGLLQWGREQSTESDWRVRIVRIVAAFLENTEGLQHDYIFIEQPDDQGLVGRTTGTQSLLSGAAFYTAAACLTRCDHVYLVPVRDWKGTTSKQIIFNRLLREYGDALPRAGGSKPWEHDAIDAIGIARFGIAYLAGELPAARAGHVVHISRKECGI